MYGRDYSVCVLTCFWEMYGYRKAGKWMVHWNIGIFGEDNPCRCRIPEAVLNVFAPFSSTRDALGGGADWYGYRVAKPCWRFLRGGER